MDHRSSSLDRKFACNASTVEPDIYIETSEQVANLGSAVHFYISETILGKVVDNDKILNDYNIEDGKEYYRFISAFHKAWTFFKPRIKEIIGVEMEVFFSIKDHKITGHLDFAYLSIEDRVVVVDWKLGYLEGAHRNQLMSYLVGVLHDTSLDMVDTWNGELYTVYLNSRTMQHEIIDQDDIKKWSFDLETVLSEATNNMFSVGSNCQYCPLAYNCKAKQEMINSFTYELSELKGTTPSRETLATLRPQAQMLKKALDAYEKLLKLELQNAPIQIGQEEYYLDDTEMKSLTSDEKTLTFLTDLLDCPVSDYIKINKTKVKDQLFAQTLHGKKGKAFTEMMENLDQKGLVEKSIKQTIKIRRLDDD